MRRSAIHPRRGAVLVAGAGLVAAAAIGAGATSPHDAHAAADTPRTQPAVSVGLQVLTLTDPGRLIRVPHRPASPRTLVTYVRYPRSPAPPGAGGAPAGSALPLIVFAHGFNVTPSAYDNLLDAWTRAGYVVAAPVFPLESRGAPGGPTRSDLVNEPADIGFVISQLLRRSAVPGRRLSGRIDPRHIAVAGHSDGGIVALSVAYDRYHRDRRIGAALVLSGARPSDGGLEFGPGEPPLLASVGTADSLNPPANTLAYYRLAHRPKFLLELVGAEHLPPFSYAQPWLGTVERVSVAFLNAYLKPRPGARGGRPSFGALPRSALLDAQP